MTSLTEPKNLQDVWSALRTLTLASFTLMLAACGGGGGGSVNDTSLLRAEDSAVVAAQVDELMPIDEEERVAVFVDVADSVPASAAALEQSPASIAQAQAKFLAQLQSLSQPGVVAANSPAHCSATDLAKRIADAVLPRSAAAVRLELSACELKLLPRLTSVRGVHADIPMSTQGVVDTPALALAIRRSFDGVSAWPTVGSSRLDGSGTVIAVLDTGVEDRHPALGASKVLPGICFSTASYGGASFCPNQQSSDFQSRDAGRSCIDRMGSRAAAIAAGCGHGTAMAAAAAGDYASVTEDGGGLARSAQILPVQVFSRTSRSTISASSGDLLKAIEWVTTEAARRRSEGESPIAALNMSLGGGLYEKACDADFVGSIFKRAFAALRAQGVVPVVAAGNDGNRSAIAFPACVSNTLSVTAARLDYKALASYANLSEQVKLVAIGGDSGAAYKLPALCAGLGYDCWASVMGTSPATALASGAAAALRSVRRDASADEIESALTRKLSDAQASALTLGDDAALRVSASAWVLTGTLPVAQSASGGSGGAGGSASPAPIPNPANSPAITPAPDSAEPAPVVARRIQVCFYSFVSFRGIASCATVSPQTEPVAKVYNYFGLVRSLSIRDLDSGRVAPDEVRVTLYTSNSSRDRGVPYVRENPAISGGFFGSFVRYVRIEPL